MCGKQSSSLSGQLLRVSVAIKPEGAGEAILCLKSGSGSKWTSFLLMLVESHGVRSQHSQPGRAKMGNLKIRKEGKVRQNRLDINSGV